MSEIKLVKRIKYAGDVHAAMMELGWDAETAAAFLDSIPDVDKEDVFEHLDLMKEAFAMAKADLVAVVRCKDCKHFAGAKGKDSGKPLGYGQCKWPVGIRGIVCADDFCSFGERRDDEWLLPVVRSAACPVMSVPCITNRMDDAARGVTKKWWKR